MLMSNVLSAKSRSTGSRSQLTEVRNQGGIPAVVYGYNVENSSISVNRADFIKTMREVGRNGVISLDLEGKKVNVILHEYQEDPIKGEIIHMDLLSVNMDVAIEANVRVELAGNAAGASEGGVVQHLLHELTVTAKPDEMPELVEVDISNLEIGNTLTVGEVRNQFSFEINNEDDEAIVTVTPPRDEEAEAVDSDEQPEEPALVDGSEE